MYSPRLQVPQPSGRLAHHELLPRIGVRPPYFALTDIDVAGLELSATAVAESPAFQEVGPMPAAELGRHAAIVGLSTAAFQQSDDHRRYYLARRAACRYVPSSAPYGSEVRFEGRLLDLDKRSARAAITATAGGAPLAAFEVDYTVLTASAFERLFRIRGRLTPQTRSPYGSLLTTAWNGTPDVADQVVEELPIGACVGHFDGYPALPVAVLMGQLSYLAGRLHDAPFRVVRGDVEASDLVWAGERARFRVARDGVSAEPDTAGAHRYRCEAWAGDRSVAAMTLWVDSVDERVANAPFLGRS
jgi:hypothetical protein